MSQLAHETLAAMYELGRDGDLEFLAMEYVPGVDLRQVVAAAHQAESSIPFEAALAIVRAAALGLDHAHRRCSADGVPLELVHRDISLSNLMITRDGDVKVIDFGIARATITAHDTLPGVVRGKASYMSPEQCHGDAVDLRTDVFALGIVLYELTTGKRCFNGTSDFERMLAVVRNDYLAPGLAVPGFPADLARVIEQALEPAPAQRFASAAALAAALDQVALARGWRADRSAVARLACELFGAEPDAVTEPRITTTAQAPTTPTTATTASIRATVTQPRRFARGTVPFASSADDDAPTRGRRSSAKLWPLLLAA
jgi:serine/threonine-protein kinase